MQFNTITELLHVYYYYRIPQQHSPSEFPSYPKKEKCGREKWSGEWSEVRKHTDQERTEEDEGDEVEVGEVAAAPLAGYA